MKDHPKTEDNFKITPSYSWVSVIDKAYDESINKTQQCCLMLKGHAASTMRQQIQKDGRRQAARYLQSF